jgi:cardiolipin synthase
VPRPAAIVELIRDRSLRFTEGNRVDLYDTGREGLAAMLAAIEGARRRVHLETYILRSDATGRDFLDALAGRARAGVEVRVLYDGFGSLGLDEAALDGLRGAGGDVVVFNPLARFWPRFAPRRRDHRKILVVDGAVAFTGGLNVGDEYVSGLGAAERDVEWRDAHVRVEGPCVRDLEAVFLESWFRADGPALAWHALLEGERPRAGNVRCAVLSDGPAHRRRRMRELLESALREAEREVRLVSPYFAPGRRVLELLGDASARGVHVALLVAGEGTDHPSLRRASRAVLPGLSSRACVHEHTRDDARKLACFDQTGRSWAARTWTGRASSTATSEPADRGRGRHGARDRIEPTSPAPARSIWSARAPRCVRAAARPARGGAAALDLGARENDAC